MFEFVFPETGEPAHVFNRSLDGPFLSVADASRRFLERWPAFHRIHPADPVRDRAAFLRRSSGAILVLRAIPPQTPDTPRAA